MDIILRYLSETAWRVALCVATYVPSWNVVLLAAGFVAACAIRGSTKCRVMRCHLDVLLAARFSSCVALRGTMRCPKFLRAGERIWQCDSRGHKAKRMCPLFGFAVRAM